MDKKTKTILLSTTIVCGIAAIYGLKYGGKSAKTQESTINIPRHSYTYDEAVAIANGLMSGDGIEYYASSLQIDDFDLEDMKEFKRPIILDLGSDDCGPCLTMKEDLEKAYEKYKNTALIHFIDVWKQDIDDKELPLYSLPTQILFKSNGEPLKIEELDEKRIDTSQFIQYIENESNEHELTTHIGVLSEQDFDYLVEVLTVKE